MPFFLQVVPYFVLKELILSRTWSKYAFGQIATSIAVFHFRKCLIGGFSSLELSFSFPLSIALSGQLPLHDQYKRADANLF